MSSGDSSVRDSYDFSSPPRGRPTRQQQIHRAGLSGPDDTSYDETKFYVASTNEHDHDESTRVRMPKWLMAQLQELVRDGRLPAYRSIHDVMRDALVHRVHYIHSRGLTDTDTDWIEREVLKGAMVRIEARRQEKLEAVKTVEVTLREALHARDPEEIDMAIAVAQGMAEHIGEPYSTQIRGHIAQVYSDLTNYANVPTEVLFGG